MHVSLQDGGTQRCRRKRQQPLLIWPGAQALDETQADLDALAGGCGRINTALAAAQHSGGGMLADTERIAAELAQSQKRSALVDHFLAQYQLTPGEVAALQVGFRPCHINSFACGSPTQRPGGSI